VRRHARLVVRASGAAALVLALSACGSTVELRRSSEAASDPTEVQLPGPKHELDVAAPATSGAGTSRPTARSGVQVETRSPDGPSVTSSVGSDVLQVVDGPGVTASTITFGVTYTTDGGTANASAGAGGEDPGDVRDYYNVLVAEVNRSGGVAGRRLVPAYYETKTTSTESADSQRLAACEHWASDVRAFVYLDAISEVARSCAEQRGMVSLSGGGNAVAKTFTRYPHYLEPAGIALEGYEGATVAGLAKTDFYGKAPVIGIVTWDDPSFRVAVANGMVPELAKLGLKPKVVYHVDVAESYGGAGSMSASISSAVLRFRQEGVTHAFIVDGPSGVCLGTCMTLLWLKAAGSQGYYPKYGMNDLNSPQAGMDAGLWGPDDVRGSRVVTGSNYDDFTDVGVTKNERRVACRALMKQHGIVPDNITGKATMQHACDNIWFLRAVLGAARIPVNRDVFVARAEALGTTYRSPMTYRTELSPTQHDGLAGFRRQALDDGCGCYRYTSGIYPR
jgi:hypothetical protein